MLKLELLLQKRKIEKEYKVLEENEITK